MPVKSFTLQGPVPAKKNMHVIRRHRGRQWVAPSEKYQVWERRAALVLKGQALLAGLQGTIMEPVWLRVVIYRPTKGRCDLTNLLQSVEDALVAGGILADDSLIHSFDGSRKVLGVGKEKARAEITITWPWREKDAKVTD